MLDVPFTKDSLYHTHHYLVASSTQLHMMHQFMPVPSCSTSISARNSLCTLHTAAHITTHCHTLLGNLHQDNVCSNSMLQPLGFECCFHANQIGQRALLHWLTMHFLDKQSSTLLIDISIVLGLNRMRQRPGDIFSSSRHNVA